MRDVWSNGKAPLVVRPFLSARCPRPRAARRGEATRTDGRERDGNRSSPYASHIQRTQHTHTHNRCDQSHTRIDSCGTHSGPRPHRPMRLVAVRACRYLFAHPPLNCVPTGLLHACSTQPHTLAQRILTHSTHTHATTPSAAAPMSSADQQSKASAAKEESTNKLANAPAPAPAAAMSTKVRVDEARRAGPCCAMRGSMGGKRWLR